MRMNRYVEVKYKADTFFFSDVTHSKSILFDKVFPTQNHKRYDVQFEHIKKFFKSYDIKKEDIISIRVVDKE